MADQNNAAQEIAALKRSMGGFEIAIEQAKYDFEEAKKRGSNVVAAAWSFAHDLMLDKYLLMKGRLKELQGGADIVLVGSMPTDLKRH